MRTIYMIQDEIRDIFANATVDEETGELAIDMAALDALEVEESEKLKAWGIFLKTEIAFRDSLKKERDRLTEEIMRYDNRIELLKERFRYILQGRKLKTPEVSVTYRTTHNVVQIEDGAEIPDKWMTVKETKTVSKTKMKEAILAGEEIDGVKLVDKVSLILK